MTNIIEFSPTFRGQKAKETSDLFSFKSQAELRLKVGMGSLSSNVKNEFKHENCEYQF